MARSRSSRSETTMTTARRSPRHGWMRAATVGGILGGVVTALLCRPVARELTTSQSAEWALIWPLIDTTFAGLCALIGASLGVLPWRAGRGRRANAPASDPSLGE